MRKKIFLRSKMAPEGTEVISLSIKNITLDIDLVKDEKKQFFESEEPDRNTNLSAVMAVLRTIVTPYVITKSNLASSACMNDICAVDRAFYTLRRKGLVRAKYRRFSNDWLILSVTPMPKAAPTLFDEEVQE